MGQFTLASSQLLKTSLNHTPHAATVVILPKVHLYFLNQSQSFNIPNFSKRKKGVSTKCALPNTTTHEVWSLQPSPF